MNKKIFLPILLILVALIGVGLVSAADADNSTLSDVATMTVDQNNVNIIQDQSDIISQDNVVDDGQGELIRPDRVESDDATNETIVIDENTDDINPANDTAVNDTVVDDATVNDTTAQDTVVNDTIAEDTTVNDINDRPAVINVSNKEKLLAGTPTKIIEDDFSVQMNFTHDQLKQIRKYVDYYISVNFDLRKLTSKVFDDGFIQQWKDLDGFYNAARTICEIHNEAVGMLNQTNYITPRYVFAHMLYYGLDNFFAHI